MNKYQQIDPNNWLIKVLLKSVPNFSYQIIPYSKGKTRTDKNMDKVIEKYLEKPFSKKPLQICSYELFDE